MFCSDCQCQFMINVEIRKLNRQTKKVMSDEKFSNDEFVTFSLCNAQVHRVQFHFPLQTWRTWS